jgi:hypothetical protein
VVDSVISLNIEEQPCIACGESTDTGWECTVCGHDCKDWYYPEGIKQPQHTAKAECKAGNLIPVNGTCPYCNAEPFSKCGGNPTSNHLKEGE